MKFKIVEAPEERLRESSAIPLQYCNAISNFGKPTCRKSPQVDILYQDRVIKGCILRNIVFYVRESVTLLVSNSSPLLSVNTMITGNIDIQLNGLNKISLHPEEYNILLINTDEHTLILHPGVYELQRYDYTNRIISHKKPEWLQKVENNESAIFEHGQMNEELIRRQSELKNTAIIDPEMEEWFYRKMRKFLHVVLEEHKVINE